MKNRIVLHVPDLGQWSVNLPEDVLIKDGQVFFDGEPIGKLGYENAVPAYPDHHWTGISNNLARMYKTPTGAINGLIRAYQTRVKSTAKPASSDLPDGVVYQLWVSWNYWYRSDSIMPPTDADKRVFWEWVRGLEPDAEYVADLRAALEATDGR